MAQGQTRLLFIRNLQMLFIRLPIIIVGMYAAGLKGVVIARVISGLISIFLAMRLVRRFTGLNLREQLAANVRAFASVAAMSAGVILVYPSLSNAHDAASLMIKIAIIVFVAAILYCGTSLLLWTFMRKPSGPVRVVQQLLGKLLAKVMPACERSTRMRELWRDARSSQCGCKTPPLASMNSMRTNTAW
jgi:hypothetical protein